MIGIIGLLAGFLNGLFASGAGQIIVFYFVFLRKKDSQEIRYTSMIVLGITSLFSLYHYRNSVQLDSSYIIILIVLAIIGCLIGNKIMDKIKGKYLNLISGIVMTSLAIISFFR